MHLVFDIFQGIGVAAAVGIRPFLPALAVGALAAGNVQINFEHTGYSFFQSAPFLLALVTAVILLVLSERRLPPERFERGPAAAVLAAAAVVLGALLFAALLRRGHYAVWPGFIGGVICALIGILATRPMFSRVRARLDDATARTIPFYGEIGALVIAALSVLAPPVGPIALALLLWLLLAGRRREGQKYAGLRILR